MGKRGTALSCKASQSVSDEAGIQAPIFGSNLYMVSLENVTIFTLRLSYQKTKPDLLQLVKLYLCSFCLLLSGTVDHSRVIFTTFLCGRYLGACYPYENSRAERS